MTHKSISDKVKLKSKKKRTHSSRVWLERQLNDPFVRQAQVDGYRSRASYKIKEMAEKFKLFHGANVIVDLGAAPGGWLQVAKELKPKSFVIGVDLQEYEDVPGTIKIIGDVTDEETLDVLNEKLEGKKVDVVLSDMAAAACGIASVDHDRIMGLLEITLDFGLEHLNKGGHLVGKVLRGGTEDKLLKRLKLHFKNVKHFKPDSSRKGSAEMYVVATGYKG